MNVIINGDFLCRSLTGIERFAYEVCTRLDSIIKKDEICIYIPHNARIIPDFKNIKKVISEKDCRVFPIWEHTVFSGFVRKNHAVPLDFSNVTPLFNPGIVFIHDIYAKLYPEDFSGKKDKLIKMYMCAMYRYAAKHAEKIITVSNFSRHQIAQTYHIDESKIDVIYNGWEHFKTIKPDVSIFEMFPQLKKGSFYFTLGSLQKRKNLKWIASYAAKHPEETFAVSGKAISGLVSDDLKTLQTLPNVLLVGYVSDGQVKALMQSCRAFIFPSYYEGFGIPPLEALSCGARIIISSAACLPELYGNCACYINPDDTDVNLEKLLNEPTAPPDKILAEYSYNKAAEELYSCIKHRNVSHIRLK